MRKPLERQFLAGRPIDCVSLLDSSDLSVAQDHCATFLTKFPRLCIVPFLFDGHLLLASFKSIFFFLALLRSLYFILKNFCDDFYRNSSNIASIGRIAIQSFCSPLCEYSDKVKLGRRALYNL